MPIYAEAKLGELLAAIPNKPKPDGSPRGTFGGSEKSLPTGISKRTSQRAQARAAGHGSGSYCRARRRHKEQPNKKAGEAVSLRVARFQKYYPKA